MKSLSEMALFLSRWVEVSILVKASVILALGLAASRLASHGRASMRHLFLAATFVMLVALPVIILSAGLSIDVPITGVADSGSAATVVPTLEVPTVPANTAARTATPQNASWSLPSVSTLLRAVWAVGTSLLLVSLMFAVWRVRRLRRDGLPSRELDDLTQSLAQQSGIRRRVEVLLDEDIPAPLTCGVWRPAILLPAEARSWSEAHLRFALIHELEHVKRGDWATQLAARLTCTIYWFHPLVWVTWRWLCLEAERSCDDAVVQRGEQVDYADQLVLLARQMSKSQRQPALGMANRTDLSTRVSSVLDGNQRRGRVGMGAAVAVGVASILVLAIAPVRAVSRTDKADITNQSAQSSQSPQASSSPQKRREAALDRALYEAADEGDDQGVTQLLGAGAKINAMLEGDGTPLIGAAREGHITTVRLLLDNGADVNLAAPGDGNPLIMAAREGHLDVVTLLLDRGANVNQMVPDDESALIQASAGGELAVVRLLVSRGADVNAGVWVLDRENKREWRSPLSMAKRRGSRPVIDFLISAGAKENQ
ncbi:MAG TPA: M56 family metallopeptidase [Pyrinomonadaceae bacterium]|nr:M56 family metallopeptidase [Pyrinomonadaceae bacterium]